LREIKKFIALVQAGGERGGGARLLKVALLPLTLLYGLALIVRELGYRSHLLRQARLPGKVISIGNLTTGGTGKTPLALKLAQQFSAWGHQPAVLTRGYGAAYQHSDLLLQAGRVDLGAMQWLADEVVLLATKLEDCWIGVGKDRLQVGRKLHGQHEAELFLLDDGFAHRQLARDLDIVLVDAACPFGNGFLLPAGSLREGKGALTRADLVLITRCESVTADSLTALEAELTSYLPAERIFKLQTELNGFRDLVTGTMVASDSLRSGRFVAFSGLGNPESFHTLLRRTGLELIQELDYGDHYRYRDEDIDHLLKLVATEADLHLITTEKDAVKLPHDRFRPNACLVAEIDLVFREREDIFLGKLREVIGC
jgi:tetraacyldisaccharide 4'-kinase